MNWSRPLGALRYCSVSGNEGGSVLTRCKGRWSELELQEHSSAPLHTERCGLCAVEVGLAELASATPTRATTPLPWVPYGVCSDWDVSDCGGES